MTENIYPYEMRVKRVVARACAECGEGPSEVEYELKDGPNKGVHRFCESCAVELGLVIPVSKAAEYLDVNDRTVRTWCRGEKLHAFQNEITGRWWIMTDPHFGGVRIRQQAAH